MYEYQGFHSGCRQVGRAGDSDLIGALPDHADWTEEETIGLAQTQKDDLEDLIPRRGDRL